MNKKGISAVVANVLIILLVVSGVVLLWAAVRPTIEETSEQIGADCLTVDLEVTGCEANVTDGNITVTRNSGDGDLGGARIIVGDTTEDCDVKNLEQLASQTCHFSSNLSAGEEVQVAVITGDGTVCNPLRSAYVC